MHNIGFLFGALTMRHLLIRTLILLEQGQMKAEVMQTFSYMSNLKYSHFATCLM